MRWGVGTQVSGFGFWVSGLRVSGRDADRADVVGVELGVLEVHLHLVHLFWIRGSGSRLRVCSLRFRIVGFESRNVRSGLRNQGLGFQV